MIDRRSSLLLSPRSSVCVCVYVYICVCMCNDNVSFIRPSGNDCVDGIYAVARKTYQKYKSIPCVYI